jgi:hypothetical protein
MPALVFSKERSEGTAHQQEENGKFRHQKHRSPF